METTASLKGKPFPKYAVLPVMFTFCSNFALYGIPMALCGSLKHYDMTTAFDRLVPVVPEFTPIYLSFFIFWIVNYTLAAYRGKDFFYRFLTADIMGRIICTLFFVLLPTMNIRPEIAGNTIFERMLINMVYGKDSATNLFPSIHCYVSFMCYIAVGGKKSVIPKPYRIFSFVWMALIFIATQVLKQHVIADLFAAVALAWGMLCLARKTDIYKPLRAFFTMLNRLVHLEPKSGGFYD